MTNPKPTNPRRRWLILLLPTLLLLIACVGIDPAPIAVAVAESLRPLLEKLGASPEDLAKAMAAMRVAVEKSLEGQAVGVDWLQLVGIVVSAVAGNTALSRWRRGVGVITGKKTSKQEY
jgi:hypothetical protein